MKKIELYFNSRRHTDFNRALKADGATEEECQVIRNIYDARYDIPEAREHIIDELFLIASSALLNEGVRDEVD